MAPPSMTAGASPTGEPRLIGKRAVVTGSGGALGRRICHALAMDGASVAGFDINGESAAETTRQLEGIGATARDAGLDLLDFEGVLNAADEVTQDWGGIDILINVAGGGMARPFVEMTLDDWDSQVQRNLTSMFTTTRAVLPHMLPGGWGRIVSISSIAAVRGGRLVRNATAYAAAKAGVIGLTKALAIELAETGITVNAIAPGAQATPGRDNDTPAIREALLDQIPTRTLGQPDDLATSVLFLCHDSAAYITGITLAQDGGHSI